MSGIRRRRVALTGSPGAASLPPVGEDRAEASLPTDLAAARHSRAEQGRGP